MTCDVCGDDEARRFSLVKWVQSERRSRGSGTIYLCSACWTRVAKPRMLPSRGRRTGAAAARRAAASA